MYFLIKASFAQFDIPTNKRPAVYTAMRLPLSLPAITNLHVLQIWLTLLPVHSHVRPWRRPAHPVRTTYWWMMGRRWGRGDCVFRRGALWFDVQVEGGKRWGWGGGALGRVRTASTCRHAVHGDTNTTWTLITGLTQTFNVFSARHSCENLTLSPGVDRGWLRLLLCKSLPGVCRAALKSHCISRVAKLFTERQYTVTVKMSRI